MEQYIKKSAFAAVIEKLKRKIDDHDDYANGWHNALSSVETDINFLEAKKADLVKEVNLENEFNQLLDTIDGAPRMWHSDEQIEWGKGIAKHFFELGMSVSNKAQKGK